MQVLEEEGISQNCIKVVAKLVVFIRISLSAFDCEWPEVPSPLTFTQGLAFPSGYSRNQSWPFKVKFCQELGTAKLWKHWLIWAKEKWYMILFSSYFFPLCWVVRQGSFATLGGTLYIYVWYCLAASQWPK